jgi:putative IMPACT (imprinted ancient) family translation regulator
MSKRDTAETKQEPSSPKRLRQTMLSNTLTPTFPTLPSNATVSTPLEDRKSKFVGYFIPSTSLSSLSRHKALLETHPEIRLADHKIMAWNIDKSTGFDDDGEKWAGKRVLNMLLSGEDEGLLCVVRWYGGIMLGPARFEHIEHVAAEALAIHHLNMKPSLASPPQIFSTPPIKTEKVEDFAEKEKLIRMLKGKDMSVESLRGMIATKKAERGESMVLSPVKEKNYERMGVDTLKRLVIARDSTIKSLRDIHRELTLGVQVVN